MNDQYKVHKGIGTEKQNSLAYTERAKAHKVQDALCTPDSVLTAIQAAAGALVGKGNLCRVFGVATDLIAFGPSGLAAPLSTDQNAAQMGATVIIIVANDDYIRTTSGVTRVEVILD